MVQYTPDDIAAFDTLPPELKELLNHAPKPFSAKFAAQLLKRGYRVQDVCDMLRGAMADEINDGTMAPMPRFTPVTARPRLIRRRRI